MQAMNGSAASSIRSRAVRAVVCVSALLALMAMVVPSIASAREKPPKPPKETYVGLGDSLAFGYSQQLFNENLVTGENPTGFEHGYVSDYYKDVDTQGRTELINYGCPGETTESMIGDNPTFIAELNEKAGTRINQPITGEAPCAYHSVDGLPLHNEYGGSKSQMEALLATIAANKAAGKPVKHITLDIGANDELHEVAKAEHEAKQNVEEKVGQIAQVKTVIHLKEIAQGEVEQYVGEQVGPQAYEESNGGEEPAFKERLVALGAEYFATHAAELEKLGNEDLGKYEAEHGAELAAYGEKVGGEYFAEHEAELNAFGKEFALNAIEAALPAEFAQINTNVLGMVIAIHDAGFKGHIVFVGTYDPYGRVGGLVTEHKELQPGFNQAAAELIGLEESTLSNRRLKTKLCYSNSEAKFNPASVSETVPNEELEEKQLDEWTNMANFNVTNGKADGPDIHATPRGYEVMAEQINEVCGN